MPLATTGYKRKIEVLVYALIPGLYTPKGRREQNSVVTLEHFW
jgi:hypothetical protein